MLLITYTNPIYSFSHHKQEINIVMKYIKLSFLACLFHSMFVNAQTTVTLQPGPTEGKDAYVQHTDNTQSTDNTNYGNSINYLYSEGWSSGGNDYDRRIFLQFDLSSIPYGAFIQSADLYLYSLTSCCPTGHSNSSNSNASWIERVTGSWSESTITWNNQPSSDTLGRASIPEESVFYADHVIDVTQLYQNIVNKPDSNRYGITVRLKNEDKYARLQYASSDYSTDTTKRPKLVITYWVLQWSGAGSIDSLIHRNGAVDIGTNESANGYKLSVDGNIMCEEVTVKMSENWPDYAFGSSYELMELKEVESYIMQHHHLPDIPSAQEVAKSGVNTSEMLRLQMEKIEQLTLYIIQLEKRIQQLENKTDEKE